MALAPHSMSQQTAEQEQEYEHEWKWMEYVTVFLKRRT